MEDGSYDGFSNEIYLFKKLLQKVGRYKGKYYHQTADVTVSGHFFIENYLA